MHLSAPSMAQDLLNISGGEAVLAVGHSAAHYGIRDLPAQRASIRAVLTSVGLERSAVSHDVSAAVAYSLVQMFVGGAGAPSDLAEPRENLDDLFQVE